MQLATMATSTGWRERCIDQHDYVWARLPFLIPMALVVARRQLDDDSQAVARDLIALRSLVFEHLTREERALSIHGARAIRDRLHDDHLMMASLLATLRTHSAGLAARDGSTEHALAGELARLVSELQAEIAVEDQLLETA
jgi:hypothetical protein